MEQLARPPAAGEVLKLRASRGAVLEGRIEGVGSVETAVLTVDALADGARPPRVPLRIDSAGQFQLQIAPGRNRVRLACAGAVCETKEVSLSDGETASVILRPLRWILSGV